MTKNFPCIFRQAVHHLDSPLYCSRRYAQLIGGVLGKRFQRYRHFVADVVSNRAIHPRCLGLTSFRLWVEGFINLFPALQQFPVLDHGKFGTHNIFVNFGQFRL